MPYNRQGPTGVVQGCRVGSLCGASVDGSLGPHSCQSSTQNALTVVKSSDVVYDVVL